LTGAIPVFMQPDYDSDWQMAHGVSPATVSVCLQQHPDAKAVLIVSPTYYGVCSDVASIAQITHQYRIPLLVDEAHGAHFGFHPDLPASALATGADLAVQSTHKTLSAFTQAAMLHVQGNRIDRTRLDRALQLVQSTSPNYLLLASLDAARQQMALEGKALMHTTLQLADQARLQIDQIPGLRVFSPEHVESRSARFRLDRTRLTVDVTGLGLTGFQADEILHEQLGITAELPSLQHLTFIISLGNTVEDIDRLVQACKTLAEQHHQEFVKHPAARTHAVESQLFSETSPTETSNRVQNPKSKIQNPKSKIAPSLTPRAAFFSSWETVPIAEAIDQISAEVVCPYPPGIPILFPGERITAAAIQQLQTILQAGGQVTGGGDSELKTLKIIQASSRNLD
ncbi:MAG TPA: lysine decarboxylase, partial [Allocoleopsis sp.]